MIVASACFRVETAWIPKLPGLRVVRTPMGEAAAGSLERALSDLGIPKLIVSTGFCGGLEPTLRPGKLILARTIHHHGEKLAVDAALRARAEQALEKAGIDFVEGPVRSFPRVVQSMKEKERLWEEGAIAVEMEGGALVRWAREKQIGFLLLKAVLDQADHVLPFASDRSLVASALSHPFASARSAWLALIAGRAIGRAIPAVISGLIRGRE